MYYRARYYDPDSGRFLQPDPLGYIDGMNLYQYAENKPFNNYDPMGLYTSPYNPGGPGFPGWIYKPSPVEGTVIINNPFDAYWHYISGGGAPAVIGDLYLQMFRNSTNFRSLVKDMVETYKSLAICNTKNNYNESGIERDFVTAEKNYNWFYNFTLGTIQTVSWQGRCELSCNEPSFRVNSCCACLCSLSCSIEYKLKDNYNFEGGNNAAMWFAPPLSFVISVGTPFDAVGSFLFFVHEEFVKCHSGSQL